MLHLYNNCFLNYLNLLLAPYCMILILPLNSPPLSFFDKHSDMSKEKGTPVIIDNGSGVCKAGFSGNDAPSTAFPAIVGYPKYTQMMVGLGNKEVYIGE